MRCSTFAVPLVCLGLGNPSARAQDPEPTGELHAAAESAQHEKGWGVTGYPIIFYSPETKAALGAGMAVYHASPSLRPDVSELELFGTQMRQLELNLKQTTFLSGNRYELFGEFRLNRSPNMAFYGVGADNAEGMREEYLDRGIVFTPHVAVQLWPGFFVGPAGRVAAFSAGELLPGGLLDQGSLTGGREELVVGAGLTARLETTDSVFFPTSGFRSEATALVHGKALGSDHDFFQVDLSHRHYVGLGHGQVLAFQARARLSSGDVPWQMLPRLGGMFTLRGYYEGRYRDRHYVAAQAEYRFPIVWRFSGAAFTDVGGVSNALSRLASGPVRLSAGGGLRFLLDRDEHINLRVDVAVTASGNSDFYVALMEAF